MLVELAAAAAIVPQHSIRGVAVDMRRAAVVAKLGKPQKIVHGKNELYTFTEFHYRGLKVTFAFDKNVSQVESRTPTDRTRTGLGVGSTRAALRRGVAGLRCDAVHCYLGTFEGGSLVTDFFLTNGKVSRVVVGRVLD
jgi:hypothetical protein